MADSGDMKALPWQRIFLAIPDLIEMGFVAQTTKAAGEPLEN